MLARGLKTLALRVAAQNANAAALARFLAGHPRVLEVNHPGLPAHPDHAHAGELLSGFGGMLSLRLHGGVAAAQRLLDALTIPTVAPSLGGVESLVTLPAQTSHAGMSAEERERVGRDRRPGALQLRHRGHRRPHRRLRPGARGRERARGRLS